MNIKPVVAFLIIFFHRSVSDSVDIPCRNTVYISKTHGKVTSACGSLKVPCKTLSRGLLNLCWGGKLFIDGEGTAENPYSCDASKKLKIRKSLFMESYREKPVYITCKAGIEFSPQSESGLNITIQGITFTSTTIVLKDTTALFNDCVFKMSAPSIETKVSKLVTQYELKLRNCSFQENVVCIHINSNNGRCNTVGLNLFNVEFKENHFHGESCGLVVIQGSKKHKCEQFAVISNWSRVTAINNSKLVTTNAKCKISNYPIYDSFVVVHAHKAHLSFTQVSSENNTRMRFLGIFGRHSSYVYVHKSRYYGHHIAEEGGVMYMTASKKKHTVINITVVESVFADNSGTTGAAFYVKLGYKRTVNLRMVNVTFKDSYGSKKGCVVCVEAVATLNALLDGIKIIHCHDPCGRASCVRRHAGICLRSVKDIRVNINNSNVFNNFNGSAIYIQHESCTTKPHGSLDVVINNTRFTKNLATHKLSKDAVVYVLVKDPRFNTTNTTRIHIYNTIFLRNLGAVRILNVEEVKIRHLSCLQNRDFCLKLDYKTDKVRDSQNSTVSIRDSNFTGNEVSLHMTNKHPSVINIHMLNTLFYQNNFGKIFSLKLETVNKKWFLTRGVIIMDGVNFTSNSLTNSGGYLLGFHLLHDGHIKVRIRRCIFNNNYQYPGISRTIQSLLYFYMKKDSKNDSCHCPRFPAYRYNNTVFFDDVTFKNNTGSLSLLYLSSGNTSFRRCLFEDNFSRQPITGAHIYVEDRGTAALSIHNSSFIQNNRKMYPHANDRLMQFVYAGANGPLQLTNTNFTSNALTRIKSHLLTIQYGGFVWIDKKTDLQCPQGSLMTFENQSRIVEANYTKDQQCTSNITRLTFSCVACPEGKYSLERGTFSGLTLKQIKTNCYPCPYGANCKWIIQSNENFWGYVASPHPPKLYFTRCPPEYCKAPRHFSKYNSCHGNRTGTMCGGCREGYTESMFNRNCRPVDQCSDGWFWVITAIYSTIVALYMIYRPPISKMLIDKIFWFKRKDLVPPNSRLIGKGHHSSGHSKILFYFYQISDLLSLQPHHEIIHRSVFLVSVISFFNFEIEKIKSTSGCPFPGLNAVTKELFRSLQVFASMAMVVVIYMLYWLTCLLTRRTRPYFAPYMAAIVEILLLGYERLAHTSLELLNCTPFKVNGRTEWRLFVDGNITCWVHWWQYALIAYNIIFVVPFVVVLLIGTTKLRQQQITALQFVAACFVPLPSLVYWLYKYCTGKTDQNNVVTGYTSYGSHVIADALLDVIQGPFRPSVGKSRGALYWDSVLIGRRLVFLCLFSFVSVPLIRLFIMTVICVCILIHNVSVMPYKHKKANSLAIVFLFMHVIMAVTNLCKAVLITDGVFPRKPTKKVIDGLMMVNIIFLATPPFLLALLVIAAVLSQIARVIVFVIGCKCLRTRRETSFVDIHDSYRPLLSSMEEEN